MDERTAAGPAALEGARSYRLCQEARRACGRAAELARWAEAAREAAAARAIEAQHARHLARVALEEAIAAGPVDRLNWLRTRREGRPPGRAPTPRPPAREGRGASARGARHGGHETALDPPTEPGAGSLTA